MGLFRRSSAAPRRWKWTRRFICLFLLAMLLVGLGPTIVAHTPLRDRLAGVALARLRGEVHVGSATLGWFSPPAFTDVEVRDAQGRLLLSAPRIEGSKTLAALLRDLSDLGEFHVVQPALQVVCSHGQTNLEEALAGFLQDDDTPERAGRPHEGVALRAELNQARLLIQDDDTGKQFTLDPVDVSVTVPHDRQSPAHVEVHARIADPAHPGRLDASVSMCLADVAAGLASLRLTGELQADTFPLAVAQPFLRRVQPDLQLDGIATTRLVLSSGIGAAGQPNLRLEGKLSLSNFLLIGPWVEPDRVQLERVELPCRVALEGGCMRVEQLDLDCDIGKVSLAGLLDPTRPFGGFLERPGQRIDLEVDLARLGRLLPSTLALPQETHLSSGGLSLHVRSSASPGGLLWEGDFRTTDLRGTYQGQRIDWKEPLTAAFTARQAPGTLPVFERGRCDADFFHLEVAGSPQKLTATVRYDLGKLFDHLQGLLDLGPARLQGLGTGALTLRSLPDGGSQVEADLQTSNVQWTSSTGRTGGEPAMNVRLSLTGAGTQAGGYRVNAGRLHVGIGPDTLDADLAEPIADILTSEAAVLQAKAQGDMGRWQARLRTLVAGLDGLRPEGQADFVGRLRIDPDAVHLRDVKLTARPVRFRGLGLTVEEPTVEVTTGGRWLRTTGALELKDLRIACPTVTLQYPALSLIESSTGAMLVAGNGTVQGDLARLRHWLQPRPPGAPGTLAGAVTGRLELRPAPASVGGGRQEVHLDLTVRNMVLGSAGNPSWAEPQLYVFAQTIYDPAKDTLEIGRVRMEGAALTCEAAGQLARLSRDVELSLAGRLGCDLEKLGPQLRPYLGQGIKLSGHEERPFRLSGSLAGPPALAVGPATPPPAAPSLLTTLSAEVGLAWQSAEAIGCQVGPGEVKGRLAGGRVTTGPIEAALNQGRLRIEPTLRLEPEPMELTLAPGRVVDRAKLNPAACAGALGFALPALAGAGSAQGEFSLDLDGARVPAGDFSRMEASGRLIIHAAQIDGGPLVREFCNLLKTPSTLNLATDNVVSFQVSNGRVHHRDLELRFPDVTVRTSGWVGMDGSLALVAEMPIPPKWVGGSKLAALLKGRTVKLPINGTLSNPKLDEQAVRSAINEFTREAGKELLRDDLEDRVRQFLRQGGR
jgi:translocation and assembly module TamB